MEKQCAGCGTVFEDGNEPKGQVNPRPYGCCEACNTSTFQHKEHDFVDGKCSVCSLEEKDHKKFVAAQPKEKPVDAEAKVS